MNKKTKSDWEEIFKGGIPKGAISCEIVNGCPVWIMGPDEALRRNNTDILIYHQYLLSRLPYDFKHRKDCVYHLGDGTERNNGQALKTWIRRLLNDEIDLPDNGEEGLPLVYTALMRSITDYYDDYD